MKITVSYPSIALEYTCDTLAGYNIPNYLIKVGRSYNTNTGLLIVAKNSEGNRWFVVRINGAESRATIVSLAFSQNHAHAIAKES